MDRIEFTIHLHLHLMSVNLQQNFDKTRPRLSNRITNIVEGSFHQITSRSNELPISYKTFKISKILTDPYKRKIIDFWTLTPSASLTFGLLCWKLLKPQSFSNENGKTN